MNAKKGLVALAVASAFASSAAMADAEIGVGHVFKSDCSGGATAPFMTTHPTDANASTLEQDDVSIDATLAGDANFSVSYCDVNRVEGGAVEDVSIAYSTDIELPNQATFTMTLSGKAGSFSKDDVVGLKLVTFKASQPNTPIVVGKVIDYSDWTASSASGASDLANKVQFEIRTDGGDFPGTGNLLSSRTGDFSDNAVASAGKSEPLPGFTQIYVVNESLNPVDFTVVEGASEGDKTEVMFDNFQASSGTFLGAAATRSIPLAVIAPASKVQVYTAGSVIETNPVGALQTGYNDNSDEGANDSTEDFYNYNMALTPASEFVDADGINTPFVWDFTDRTASTAGLYLEASADIGLTGNADDSVRIIMERNLDGGSERYNGVTDITFGTNEIPLVFNTNNERFYGIQGVLGTDFGENDFTNKLAPAELKINVKTDNSVELLPVANLGDVDWSIFRFDYQINGTSQWIKDVPVEYSAENGSSHYWTMNGTQFKVPNINYVDGSGDTSNVRIVNEYDRPAVVNFTAIVTADGESEVFNTAVELGTIDAASHRVVSVGEIVEALGLNGDNYEMTVNFSVSAPQNEVHATVESATGEEIIGKPVLFQSNNQFDGRQWR